ncbi:hypothetical protein GLOIN_2v1785617 [Rhizophagus irregularis DAOM 181602=DAOM 197198]|nr:hypothetical protein GLOIN_2v1785617 [Rhizophagus irregularis DAOM 181602=DAOM 197198]
MKKAFDSVGLDVLKRALLRIDILATMAEWIIALFDYRSLRIATAYGLSDGFIRNDGIDQVPICAYMDDTIFLESSKYRMQEIVDIANEFYLINDIDINAKKSELIIINPTVEKQEQNIELGRDRSIVQATNDEIRYLGVWFSNKPSRRRWMQRLSTIVNEFSQIMILTEHDWNQVFTPIMKLVKNWLKLSKNTPSSLLFHEGGFATSTQIRLRDAQLKSLITDPIFDCDLNVMHWIKSQTRKNVSFNALVITKTLDMSMAVDPIDKSNWSITGGKEPILKFFKQFQLTKYIYRINQSAHYPIFYIDQLFIRGTYLMTWKQYRRLALLPVQGRTARWYRDVAHLCTSRIDNLTVSNELEITKVNHWPFLQDIIPDARRKQAIFIRESSAESDIWTIGKVNKIRCHKKGILVNYRPGYNDNGIIKWQNMGRSITAECCNVAILDKVPNKQGWNFPYEWINSNQLDASIPNNNLPSSALDPIIILPSVQDIWIHRWI